MATRDLVPRNDGEGSIGTLEKRWGSVYATSMNVNSFISVVAAGGTADAITADFTPNVSLTDRTLCAIVAAYANATTTPTFSPDSLTAHVITKCGGNALVAGDIPGAGAVCLLEYNSANTRWELLNPATYWGGGTDVPVTDGGTGVSTLTDNGLIYGNGTAAVGSLAEATDGQLPIGDTGGPPILATLTAGDGIDITNAAGSVTIATDLKTNGGLVIESTELAVDLGASSITGTLVVGDGGTGATTLTDHGVLVGSGTDAVTPLAAGTNGQVLVGSTGADPVFATITDGEGIDTTLGAGTLSIACEDASSTNKGVIEIATDAECIAGTDTARAITAANLAAKLGTQTDGGLLVGAGTTAAVEALAVGLTTQILVGGGAGTNPAWGTDIPTAVTIGSAYIHRVGGTDVAIADGGTGQSTAQAAIDALTSVSSATNEYVLTKDTATGNALYKVTGGTKKNITQATHGFAAGDVVYYTGAAYAKAKADASATAEVIGIVTAAADASNFTLMTEGHISGLSGLTAGAVYFLSPTTAGALTLTEPTTVNHISKPILFSDSTTSGYFHNFRGAVITDETVVMASDYDAHTILAATTDNTPVALTVGEQTVVGRITGGSIAALSVTQAQTLVGLTFTAGKTLTLTESLAFNAAGAGALRVATAANTVGNLAVGATTEILVGGGAATVPVWTTATGSGAPVRATSPELTTPNIGAAIGTSLDAGTTTLYGSRAITVDTGGVLNINIGSAAGDDFTVDTNKLVVEGDTGNVGINDAAPDEKLTVIDGSVVIDAFSGVGRGIFFRDGYSPNGANNSAAQLRNMSIRSRGLESAETVDGLEINGYDGIVFGTNGDNDRMVIQGSTGYVGIGVTVPACVLDISGAAGGQIKFPATQNASANANTLDDYEEGSWTPALTFGGGNTGITYEAREGVYTKIGNIVTVTGYMVLTSNGSSTGAALITGLPFTVYNTYTGMFACAVRITNITFANQFLAWCSANATTVALYESTEAGSATQIAETDISDTAIIAITATYRVA